MGGEATCRDDTPLRVADEVVGPDKISPLGEVLGKRTAREEGRRREAPCPQREARHKLPLVNPQGLTDR